MNPGARRRYALVTLAYWADTLADGAIRTLVLFHFHSLGFGAAQVAALFLTYEAFGVVTNWAGGRLAARFGLHRTLYLGLITQVLALTLLVLPDPSARSVAWVLISQSLSGIAKDLTKMSSKSAVKVVAGEGEGRLFRWVAALTGSKNALKGVGFFLGAALLSAWGFRVAAGVLLTVVLAALITVFLGLRGGLGEPKPKSPFGRFFSPDPAVNRLGLARLFLFAARDVWFVIALPVHLSSALGWPFWQSGAFLALWVIGYGLIQALAPALWRGGSGPRGGHAAGLAIGLAALTALLAAGVAAGYATAAPLILGLALFGALFALNSSVHSFLILAYAGDDQVARSVGLYYSANAVGRLLGTILSGVLYQWGGGGLTACLGAAAAFLFIAGGVSLGLPRGRRADA
jgi:hypothetical protein